MRIAEQQNYLSSLLMLAVITAVCYILGYIARPYENLSTFWPANSLVAVLILNFKIIDKVIFSFIFFVFLCLLDSYFFKEANAFYINIPNLVFVLIASIGLANLKLDLKVLSEIQLLKIFAVICFASLITSLIGGAVTFKTTEFFSAMARWGCEQLSTAILVVPLLLMYKTQTYLKRKFSFFPLLTLILYYCFIFKFTAAVNICLIVPILILCAIFYNLRITAWLVTLNGFFLIFLVSYGIIKTGSYFSDSTIFTTLNYYRISIVATVSSALFIAVLVNNNEMIKERLQKSQWIDDLSQLLNRKGLIEDIKTGRFLGKSDSLLIAIIDIDNFKVINDSKGHLMGDQVIMLLAEQLEIQFKQAGLYRYGGDEFILILNLDSENQFQHKQKLEEFGQNFFIESQKVLNIEITLSVGYTILFDSQLYCENLNSLLADADRALYLSKSLGKNTVSIY